ncbi:hypothetical protein Taro_033039, partial [Colocasia esculenta]|nr:hypothetical protein [Colocasia esculenta]
EELGLFQKKRRRVGKSSGVQKGSRGAPPRGRRRREEEEEFLIEALLIRRFGAVVLWVGAVVLWFLSRHAQVLVNLLNSQAVYGVGRHAYLLGFFESSHSKRLELSCSRLYSLCMSHHAQVLVNLLNSQAVCGVVRPAYLLGFIESSHSKRLESSCSRQEVGGHMCATTFLCWRHQTVPLTLLAAHTVPPSSSRCTGETGVPVFEEGTARSVIELEKSGMTKTMNVSIELGNLLLNLCLSICKCIHLGLDMHSELIKSGIKVLGQLSHLICHKVSDVLRSRLWNLFSMDAFITTLDIHWFQM